MPTFIFQNHFFSDQSKFLWIFTIFMFSVGKPSSKWNISTDLTSENGSFIVKARQDELDILCQDAGMLETSVFFKGTICSSNEQLVFHWIHA